MLAEYFVRYKERHPGELALVFVGPISDKAPEHPDIVVTGTVSEADKWDILGGAEVVVNPSAYESFSLVLLEAWSLDVPVLVDTSCAATMEHCRRSGGGLWFESYRSFEVTVERLMADGRCGGTWGKPVGAIPSGSYRWPSIIDRYTQFLLAVAPNRCRPPVRAKRLVQPSSGREYIRQG